MEMTQELIEYLKQFRDIFGDIVPFRELPSTVTEKDLIEAIKKSIKENKNLLPYLFEYGLIDADSNKIV